MRCHYCDERAIGYEHERWGLYSERINVCKACAHYGVTVYLRDGGTWMRRSLDGEG